MFDNKIAWLVPTHRERLNQISNFISTFERHSKDVQLYIMWTFKSENILNHSNSINLYLEDYFTIDQIQMFVDSK